MTEHEEGTGGVGASFTDLMTSLAVIFVLLTVVLFNRRASTAEKIRTDVVKALQGSLRAAGLPDSSVKDDTTSVIIILPDSAFFDRGKYGLLPQGDSIVRRLMPSVADTLCNDNYISQLETIIVEGHTDVTIPKGSTREIGRLYNLGLSQRRSMEFVSVATAGLMRTSDSANARKAHVFNCFLQLASATGRGSEELLKSPNVTDTSQAQRRVILRIRLKTVRPDSVALAIGAADSSSPH